MIGSCFFDYVRNSCKNVWNTLHHKIDCAKPPSCNDTRSKKITLAPCSYTKCTGHCSKVYGIKCPCHPDYSDDSCTSSIDSESDSCSTSSDGGCCISDSYSSDDCSSSSDSENALDCYHAHNSGKPLKRFFPKIWQKHYNDDSSDETSSSCSSSESKDCCTSSSSSCTSDDENSFSSNDGLTFN